MINMATAREVIQFSLRYIGKDTPSIVASDATYNLMLTVLNQLLDRWFKLGLRAAVSTETIPSLDSVVPYPDFALQAIQYNLAIDGWPLFDLGKSVSLNVRELATSTKNELWTISAPNPHSVFPGVLPIGSGNEWHGGGVLNDRFYPDLDEPIYGCCDSNTLKTPSNITLTGVKNSE
ncbi:MAG: hypothetical protein V3V84_07605 [Candidatus Bathyarchaeia archaeon]